MISRSALEGWVTDPFKTWEKKLASASDVAKMDKSDSEFPDTISNYKTERVSPMDLDPDPSEEETKEDAKPDSDLIIDNSAILCQHRGINPLSKELKRVPLVSRQLSLYIESFI